MNEKLQVAIVVSVLVIICMIGISFCLRIEEPDRDVNFLTSHMKSFDEKCKVEIGSEIVFITFSKSLDPDINLKDELDGYISEKSKIKGIIIKFQQSNREFFITKEKISLIN